MSFYLKYNTASQEVPLGPFLDDTDGKTPETGLSIANSDIKLFKNGATSLANKNSGGGTHLSNGIYYAVLDATDTNTLGPMRLFVSMSGALPIILDCCVLPAQVYDSLIAGSDLLDVAPSATDVRAAVGLASANLDTQIAAVPAALLDGANDIETGWSLRKALRVILASCAGKLSGAASTTVTIRNVTDSKTRITATVDGDGNRTAVSHDNS